MKKWETKAEVQENHLLCKFERYFSPTEDTSPNRGVLSENASKDISRKMYLRKNRDSSTAKEVLTINLDDLKVDSLPKRRTRMERCTTPSNTTTKSTKKSSSGSRLQRRNKISALELHAKTVIMKKTENAKKAPENVSRSPEAEGRPLVQSGFNDRLRGKLPPVHTRPSMANYDKATRGYSNSIKQRAFESCQLMTAMSMQPCFCTSFWLKIYTAETYLCQSCQSYFYETWLGLRHCTGSD